MSQLGSPQVGDQPSWKIDTSYGTEIPRYAVVQGHISTVAADQGVVGLCGTADTERATAIGIVFREWPYVPQYFSHPLNVPTDISNYDTDKNPKDRITVKETGYSWVLVKIPLGGDAEAITPMDWLVPSSQSAGGAKSFPASALTASYASADIVADNLEMKAVIGRAMSLIHVPTVTKGVAGRPALGMGTLTNSLTALTNAETYGFVFAKLGK